MSTLNDVLNKVGIHLGTPVDELMVRYTSPESSFINIEGMRLHFRKTGTGPVLLLIHGIGSSLHTWSQWHQLLSGDFTVVSLDIPGFGLTGPHLKGDYSIEMYNRVISGLLDHLSEERVFIAGNSLGGLLCWNYALYHADRVIKMVLLNTAGLNTSYNELSDIGFLLAIHPFTKSLTHYLTPKLIVKASLLNAVNNPNIVTHEKVTTYFDLLMRKGNRQSFSIILKDLIVNENDNISKIKNIDVPTLILWGINDNLINLRFAYEFHRAIRNSKLITYEDVGHLPMEENPEQSAEDVLEFLKD